MSGVVDADGNSLKIQSAAAKAVRYADARGGREGRDVRNAASPNSSLGVAAARVRGVSFKCYDYSKDMIEDNSIIISLITFDFQLHDHGMGYSSNGHAMWYCAGLSRDTK